MIKSYSIEIKWGLIFVALGLLWMLFEKSLGLHSTHIQDHAKYTNLYAIPAIIVYIWALMDKRKNAYNGLMNYKQAFISGLVITGIVTLLSPLSQWITLVLITPEYLPNVIEYTVKEGKMSQQEAETYFSLSHYMVQSVIFAPVMGIVTTAIVAFFVKKKA